MKNSPLLIVVVFLLISCSKEILQHKLTVLFTPSNGGNVSPPSNSYEKGQSLQMMATPAPEYVFKEWIGDLRGIENPTTLVIDKDKQVTGLFEKRQYPLNLTIEGSGTVNEEVIAVATQAQYPSGTTVRLTPQPLEGWTFSNWTGDLSSSDKQLDLKIDKPLSITATFNKINLTSIKIENPIDTLVISQKHKYKIVGIYSNGASKDISDIVKLSVNSNVTLLENNFIIGAKSGSHSAKISLEKLEIEDQFYVNYFEETLSSITSNLKESNSNVEINVPVVIINFFPTSR